MDTLQIVWFVLVCVLFFGYFVLEGFDYGVAMLWRAVGRDDRERRMVLHTIGPWWDGNQTWLITAGGAMFASFPGWYASLFSGFYLPLFAILVGLVLRGVSFEFWGKHESPRWRAAWEWAAIVGSGLPALLWGVAWANVIRGVPMDADHDVTASLLDLLHPYALLGGLAGLSLFVVHGAQFLTLRLDGAPLGRARRIAALGWPLSVVLVAGFLAWTVADQGEVVSGIVAALAVVALLAVRAPLAPGWRFACGAVAIVAFFGAQFAALYPDAIVAASGPPATLTLADASSSHYTLTVMTVVGCILLPIVLLYQGWSFWVLRHRLDPEHYELPKVELKAFDEPRRP